MICNDEKCTDYILNLYNGIATCTISIPKNSNIGDLIKFSAIVSDNCSINEFREHFSVLVENPEKQNYKGGSNHSRIKPSSGKGKGARKKQSGLSLPEIRELHRADWNQHNLTKESALIIKYAGEEYIYDYSINMDNIHLQTELKYKKNKERLNLLKARYKFSMVLLGLSIIKYYQDNPSNDEDFDIEDFVKNITSIVSPIILPMIESMSELTLDEFTPSEDSISA